METMMKDLGEIITGNTPSKKNEAFWNSGDICFVKPDIISDNGVNEIFESNEYISERARKKARIVSRDSIFITCIGSIGKIGIALEGEYAFNQQINAIVPNDKVVPKYLAYNLLYNKPRLVSIANAPVVPIINKSQFGNFTINIDSDKNKQSEIVDVLDKLTHIIKQRNDELFDLENLIKARFVEMFGDIATGNYKYDTRKLGDVANVGSSHRVFTTEFVKKGIPFYRGTEIGELANGNKPAEPFYISEEHYNRLVYNDTKPQVGDLLLPSICNKGQVWMVDTDEPFYYKDGRVLCISPDREIFDTKYLEYFMKAKTLVEYPKLGSGSTFAEFKIFLLKNIDVLIPPRELQEQFSMFVHQVDKSKFEELKVFNLKQKIR